VKARLLAWWDELRSSYWFLPSVMTVGAIVLSFAMTRLDAAVGADWIQEVPWLYANKPEGARTLLSTVAGSMIGVAGVTFSITIASVVYASGQYGPRLLVHFMDDRGNQITLGTFIATFMYCLLVLRTIRSADEPPVGAPLDASLDDLAPSFVPHLAVVTAVLLTLASIAVFIYFIHHVPESIHVSNVIARVGRELRRRIDALFPEPPAPAPDETDTETEPGDGGARDGPRSRRAFIQSLDGPDGPDRDEVVANSSGYVQGIDHGALLELAADRDLVLRVDRPPGSFVSRGDALASAWPAERLDDDDRRRVRFAFAWGRQRTGRQDVLFLLNELVEIAARALSPGVNDPFTAMGCLDWLGDALKSVGDRDVPDADRYDGEGALRVIAEPIRYEELVDHAFGQLRPYVAPDRNAVLHTLSTLGELGRRVERPERLYELRRQADALLEAAEGTMRVEADREALQARHRTVLRELGGAAT
jgi:uncharacterized membrane protein